VSNSDDLKRNHQEDQQDPKTTGHSWDGIEEFDNPDPKWLRMLFYGMLAVSLIYWILYPSFPSQRQDGVLSWSQYKEADAMLQEVHKLKAPYIAEFNKSSFEEIINNPKLLKFALAGGRSAFQNNCAVCHGAGGMGQRGYPNLTSGNWLWGGKPSDIYTTLLYGIRSTHDETRQSQMAAFGRDGILKHEEIELMVDMVIDMHKGITQHSTEATALYKQHCASCHGPNGEGGREFGAPKLNSSIWLYGGERETVYDVIYNGRQGVMPYWKGRLDDATIRQLVIYVHQLGGGE
jgi:cytochrome c oxidase cbb3-type subunit 3